MAEHPSFANVPPGEPVVGKTYRADGWALINLMPNKEQFLNYWVYSIIGRENIVVTSLQKVGELVSGQAVLSPFGLKVMEAFNSDIRH